MDTAEEKELINRLEALEANSEKQLLALESTIELMGSVLDLQGQVLAWATKNGFEKVVKKVEGA